MRRRIDTHEECLKAFATELKRDAKMLVADWRSLDVKVAHGRRAVLIHVFSSLRRQAESHGIALADLGLVDYQVPDLPE
jgi:hypothetical protein